MWGTPALDGLTLFDETAHEVMAEVTGPWLFPCALPLQQRYFLKIKVSHTMLAPNYGSKILLFLFLRGEKKKDHV